MKIQHGLVGILIILNVACSIFSSKTLNLQVSVTPSDNNIQMSDVKIKIVKDKMIREYQPLADGKINIEPAYKPPFLLIVDPNDKSVLSDTVQITSGIFDENGFGVQSIQLKKRFTTLKGQVIDIDTKMPVPLCTIIIEPFGKMIETDSDGYFIFKSADFNTDLTYTLYLSRSLADTSRKVYNRKSENISSQVIRLYEVNDLGKFEVESRLVDDPTILGGNIIIPIKRLGFTLE